MFGELVEEALRIAKALIFRFEGFRSRPYLCPAGVATIGYGSTVYANGVRVQLTDPPITVQEAEALVDSELRRHYLPAVLKLCTKVDTAGRLAALLDFTYNLGVGRLKNSTLRRCANQEDWDGVRAQLALWIRGGGKVLRGLVLRREANIALI